MISFYWLTFYSYVGRGRGVMLPQDSVPVNPPGHGRGPVTVDPAPPPQLLPSVTEQEISKEVNKHTCCDIYSELCVYVRFLICLSLPLSLTPPSLPPSLSFSLSLLSLPLLSFSLPPSLSLPLSVSLPPSLSLYLGVDYFRHSEEGSQVEEDASPGTHSRML